MSNPSPIGRININIVWEEDVEFKALNTLEPLYLKRDTSPIGTGPGPRLALDPVPDWQKNRSPIGRRTGP